MTTIKQAKYRVKNEQGTYDVVHFETDIAMVNGLDDKVLEIETSMADRYTKAEADELFQAINGEVDAVEEIANGLAGRLDEVNTQITTLQGEDTRLAGEIQSIKGVLANVRSDNKVFATMEEFKSASLEPKIGDLVYVIDVKKAFIFKGIEALAYEGIPAGWVLFDEITTELDLVNYVKKAELQAVQSEVANHGERLTIVESTIDNHTGRIDALEAVNGQAYTKAQVDVLVDRAVTEQMTVCGAIQPTGKKQGHVWIELA